VSEVPALGSHNSPSDSTAISNCLAGRSSGSLVMLV